MKREVSRERNMPAFKVPLANLEVLLARLAPLFDGGTFSPRITISLKDEELTFESFEELSAHTGLPPQITSFRVWIYGGDRTLSFRSGGVLGSGASVSASADNEAWCAGAVEVVWLFIQPYRLWYHWLRGRILSIAYIVVAILPTLQFIFARLNFVKVTYSTESALLSFAWLVVFVVLAMLFFGRKRLLPQAILQVSTEETWLRKHYTELVLLLATLSVVIAIVGLFVA